MIENGYINTESGSGAHQLVKQMIWGILQKEFAGHHLPKIKKKKKKYYCQHVLPMLRF